MGQGRPTIVGHHKADHRGCPARQSGTACDARPEYRLAVAHQGDPPPGRSEIALGASRGATGAPSEADILKAAEAFFRSGELSAAFTAANPRVEITAARVRNDPDVPGQSIVHVEQRIDGIPVFGSSGRVIVSPSLAVTQLTTTFCASRSRARPRR